MRCLDLALAPPRVHPAGTVAADLPVAREPEVVLLARHAGGDEADARPTGEVLADVADHGWLAAGPAVEAEKDVSKDQHGHIGGVFTRFRSLREDEGARLRGDSQAGPSRQRSRSIFDNQTESRTAGLCSVHVVSSSSVTRSPSTPSSQTRNHLRSCSSRNVRGVCIAPPSHPSGTQVTA